MASMPLSDDLGRRARLPWYYGVVVFLNLALILVLEMLLLYRTPLPLTEAVFAEQNPAYQGAVIRNTTQNSSVSWYLVETREKELHLIPVQRNEIRQDRGRIRMDQTVTIPADSVYLEVQTKAGIGSTTVMVGTDVEPWGDEPQDYPVKLRSKYSRYSMTNSMKYTLTLYVFLALILSIGEGILWRKIKA